MLAGLIKAVTKLLRSCWMLNSIQPLLLILHGLCHDCAFETVIVCLVVLALLKAVKSLDKSLSHLEPVLVIWLLLDKLCG
jgi:hypothetical protein